jgi:hypothetical protein
MNDRNESSLSEAPAAQGTGYYYLHTNGALIYKRDFGDTAADLRESDFVRAFWPIDPTDRATAWALLVEALAMGVDKARINELAAKWKCDDADAPNYADYLGLRLFMDGSAWCATCSDFQDIQSSACGFGDTALDAFAALCSDLGFKGRAKMWGHTFESLTREVPTTEGSGTNG